MFVLLGFIIGSAVIVNMLSLLCMSVIFLRLRQKELIMFFALCFSDFLEAINNVWQRTYLVVIMLNGSINDMVSPRYCFWLPFNQILDYNFVQQANMYGW